MFGNLEVTPPLDGWPFGRIYYGGDSGGGGGSTGASGPGMVRKFREFLAAQEVQGPIEIDTTWLDVGHVDEIVSFVPYPDGGAEAFRILIASPAAAYAALFGQDATFTCLHLDPEGESACEFARSHFLQNLIAHGRIYSVRNELMEKLGLNSDIFIEVPVLFTDYSSSDSSPRMLAWSADMVNLLVVSGDLFRQDPAVHDLVIPDRGGTKRIKIPPFLNDIEQKLRAIGYIGLPGPTLHFIDSSEYFKGEIHCGTNSVRQMPHELEPHVLDPQDLWWHVID